MALQKTYNYKGFDAEYWMIDGISDCKTANTANVTFRLYKDKATREADPHGYIYSMNITVPAYQQTVDALYEAAKSAETALDVWTEGDDPERVLFFADAEDV